MAKTASRRGVALVKRVLPSGKVSWLGRWTDPRTGKRKFISMESIGKTSAQARNRWARDKSAALLKERGALAVSRPVEEPKRTRLSDAVAEFDAETQRRVEIGDLRPATLRDYAVAGRVLSAWAAEAGLEFAQDIRADALPSLKAWIIDRPRHVSEKSSKGRKAKRGARVATAQRRSPSSANHDLRVVRAALAHWRRCGLVNVTRDELADRLPPLRVERQESDALGPQDARSLILACLRHDAETNTAAPLSLVALSLLLLGVRSSEFLALRWDDVNPDHREEGGSEPVGAVTVQAAASKTRRARVVSFAVSPAMRPLLAAWKVRTAAESSGLVFGDLVTASTMKRGFDLAARRHGGPRVGPQRLRRTTGSVLVCAPGILGSAAVALASHRQGHTQQIAEKFYQRAIQGLPRDARTVEDALGIADLVPRVLDVVQGRPVEATPENAVPRAVAS